MSLSRLFLLLITLCHAQMTFAHEFWIEPEEFQVKPGDEVTAHLRNGQNFAGNSHGWFENRFTRFEMVMGNTIAPVEGRMGDTPAIKVTAPLDGLMVLLHETTPSTLTYNEWDKFLAFAAHKDFPDAAAKHVANGWSQEKFKESYTRHAKSLVAVGSGAGADRAFGLMTEFIALTNPYMPAFSGLMQVELRYNGTVRPNAQVEIFDRAPDGTVTVTTTRTDAAGIARIPVRPGHDYLLDGVVLRPYAGPKTGETAPVWETLWAALTFAVPN